MIHAVCDFCGKDCDRTANLLTITAFQDFARYHNDKEPYGHREPSKSFVMCSECLRKHNLPNPYHGYNQITDQKLNYEKNLDNYTEEDFRKDNLSKK